MSSRKTLWRDSIIELPPDTAWATAVTSEHYRLIKTCWDDHSASARPVSMTAEHRSRADADVYGTCRDAGLFRFTKGATALVKFCRIFTSAAAATSLSARPICLRQWRVASDVVRCCRSHEPQKASYRRLGKLRRRIRVANGPHFEARTWLEVYFRSPI